MTAIFFGGETEKNPADKDHSIYEKILCVYLKILFFFLVL